MKFSTREDVEAPIEDVFDMLSEFESFERSALRRGADVRRTIAMDPPAQGMQWAAAFDLRGKRRQLTLDLVRYERPHAMDIQFGSVGLGGCFQIELIALSRTRTRIAVALEASPKSFSGRVLLQPLKLAKRSLTKRFKLRVAEYAMGLEERYKAKAGSA